MEAIPVKTVAPEALEILRKHSWPGNVRQLENAVERAAALSGERPVLDISDFPLAEARVPARASLPEIALPDGGLDFEETLTRIERSIVEQALRRTGGNKKAAADMLRMKRTTLSAKIRSLAAGQRALPQIEDVNSMEAELLCR